VIGVLTKKKVQWAVLHFKHILEVPDAQLINIYNKYTTYVYSISTLCRRNQRIGLLHRRPGTMMAVDAMVFPMLCSSSFVSYR
jgi:hypothetical protein